jgi:hypothetical protein
MENEMIEPNTVLDLNWLMNADLNSFKQVASLGSQKMAELNLLLQTPEGGAIARELANGTRSLGGREAPVYIPIAQRSADDQAAFWEEAGIETVQIAEDIQRADAQAAADAAEATALSSLAEPVVETPAAPVAAEVDAEAEHLRAAGITVHKSATGQVVRLVQDYQVKDESGRPIGRPTHLEAKSFAELIFKQKTAHENAVRYAERTKQNRAKSQEIAQQSEQLSAQAMKNKAEAEEAVKTAGNEPAKIVDAVRKVTKADADAEQAVLAHKKAQLDIINAWLTDHSEDYYNCEANTQALGGYLTANKLSLSYDNLERAYQSVRKQLAPLVPGPAEPSVAVAPNAPAAATAASPVTAAPIEPAAAAQPAAHVPVTPAEPASRPAATVPAVPSAAVKNTPAARRPGVNGSLPPGTLTAVRPSAQQPVPQATTRAETLKLIKSMPNEEYRKKLAQSAQFRQQLRAAGIEVIGYKD